jgi:coenzyme F420-reducing hydrogenase delta subunit/ferredoxin
MKKVASLNHKTLIFGNGPCAHYIAEDLLSTNADIVIATTDKTCDLSTTVGSGSIEILADTRLVSCRGAVGNFRLLADQNNKEIKRTVAGIIIAEEDQRKPNFSFYGLKASSNVITLSKAKELLLEASHEQSILSSVKKMVFLTGLAKESHPAIAEEIMRSSLRLQSDFNLQTYILTGNLKVAADGLEALYRETKEAGVVYIKFTETRPEIYPESDDSVQIEFVDEITLKKFRLTPDITVVDETIVPSDYAADLSRILGVDTDSDGFVQADNVHRFTVFTNRKGIIVAGPSRSIQASGNQANDAAIASLVSTGRMAGQPAVPHRAEIDKGQCIRCLTCYRLCPYRAITLDTRVIVEPNACERCGICAAQCPRGAIQIKDLEPKSISKQMAIGDGLEKEDTFTPLLIAFCCSRSAVQARKLAQCMGHSLPSGLKVIEVPCSGSISFDHLFAAFKNNADGVLVLTCHEGNCHSERGNIYARQTVDQITDRFSKIGFEKERILMQTLASNMGTEFVEIVTHFEENILKLGPSRLKKN